MTEPVGRERPRHPISARVLRREQLSPSLVRLVVGDGDIARFDGERAAAFADAYVKVMFLHPEADYDRPIDMAAIRTSHPAEHWPKLRTYTVREWDADAQELTLDFVVHGEEGLAGPWAASVGTGAEILLNGPGGGYSPDPEADWHLLVGDDSALPAIAAALQRLRNRAGDPAETLVFIEVHDQAHEIPLAIGARTTVHWVHRGDEAVGLRLVEQVGRALFPAGRVHAFVHGEAGAVRQLRRHLRGERGIGLDQLSISGYWRLGADDEAWRAAKRDSNTAVEAEDPVPGG
ncbi:siderophore-interacting protein [Jatrophihabitans telluris]|uniref:Siderophore-interacting protein n=1 Tax=Jatrophihabitans telluris TaxID=2038343 RepID=A0ABY4QV16_9ACTN|nr:siderophore-interacting protein [Jatrophihabitans telluris]UQX86835.1 siderophore-interacting protein [Jatrophihabitans telluris]